MCKEYCNLMLHALIKSCKTLWQSVTYILFLQRKQVELGDKMDLSSYLLKPVQRMGKYALLLKQIIKECPETDPEYSELKVSEL